MKPIVMFLFLIIASANHLFSQTNSCGVEFLFDKIDTNYSLPFSKVSLTGIKNKKDADAIVKLLTVTNSEDVLIEEESLCEKFKSMMVYKKYKLYKIEIYSEVMGNEILGVFRFMYSK